MPKALTVLEGQTAHIPISISSDVHPEFTVDLTYANGTAVAPGDYAPTMATVDYPDGSAGPVYIDVPTVQNNVYQGPHNFYVTISLPPGTPSWITVDETTDVTILDAPATTTPSTTTEGVASPSTTVITAGTTTAGAGTLSNTGFNTAWTLMLGTALMALGAGVLLLVRRRA